MSRVSFTIYGIPVAKGRPRFSRTPYGVRAVTPEKTVVYENLVRMSYREECLGKKLEGQISARIEAYFPIPKSTSKKKREAMANKETMHTKKPDADNIAKAVLDALNGIAYDDDNQICMLFVKKYYGEEPRVEVTLREIKME